jgi:hypothetical protein
LKARQWIGPALLLTGVLLAGCNAVPTSYEQGKADQDQRSRFEAAGVQYKSRAELRAEAAEMRRLADATSFAPLPK